MTRMRWPMVVLGDVLRRNERWTTLDPEHTYRQVTVRLWGKGVTLRGVCRGADIAASQQVEVHTGQFIVSRIDARHGAVGLVPAELDGAVVSGDFPCFDVVSDRILPGFMGWLSRSAPFVNLCRGASEGSTNRVRLKEARLLASRIALPPLDEQHCIIVRLDAVSARLKACAETAERQEAELAAMLQQAFARITTGSPRARMADVAPLVRRPIEVKPDGRYQELGIRSFGRGPFHKPSLSGLDAGSKRLFRIEPGDLVFNIVFAWEGAVAIARPEDTGRVGSHRFLTCVADETRVSAEILRFWFLSREGLAALGQASPGGAGRNRTLGLDGLSRIEVPIPSLDAQAWFEALHARAASLRALNAAAAGDAAALLPAMLHQTFSPAAC